MAIVYQIPVKNAINSQKNKKIFYFYRSVNSSRRVETDMDLYGEKPIENVSEPMLGEIYGDKVTYYVRKGKHFLSRDDWRRFLSAFDNKIE